MPVSAVDVDDDTAIARLLADEARTSSARYAGQGLSALLPKRPAGSAPKPNTRFLKALVRDADSHNAALRRKEDRERVERLRHGGSRSKSIQDQNSEHAPVDSKQDKSTRHPKRRRLDDTDDLDRHEERRTKDRRSRHHPRHDRHSRTRSDRQKRNVHDQDESKHRQEGRSGNRTMSSPDSEDRSHRERRRRSRRRSRSPVVQEETLAKHTSRGAVHEPRRKERQPSESFTDPLEDLVGPLPPGEADRHPPPRSKGRGAYKSSSTSNIDAHFSSRYDPAMDVHPDSELSDEREDWDMALEALRDRQAWKQKHADRMRQAGFGDADIQRWEDSGREKDIKDVRWASKGQVRAWDVGKEQNHANNDTASGVGRLTP
jgi:hypothetical protein